MRVLGLDIGTSSVKAGYWDGRRFAGLAREVFGTRMQGVEVEVSPAGLMRAVFAAGRKALDGRVADAVAVDVFSTGLVVTDARGRARTGIITHQDRRSVAEAEALEREVGRENLLRAVGNRPFPGGIATSTLAWLKRHMPGVLGEGARVGQASSLVMRELTGEWVIDPSQAAFLGLLDVARGGWHGGVCGAVGVREEMLPGIRYADEVMGRLGAGAARRLGVGGMSGVPVVGGLVDTGAAVLTTGMGVGQLVHNAGSTDVLALCLREARPGADVLTRPVGTGAVLAERWLAASTIAASGSSVAWARRVMFSELSEGAFNAVVRKVCRAVMAGKGGGEEVFEAYLAGDRTSLTARRGAFGGLTLGTTREAMLGAIVRALVEASRVRYERLAGMERVRRTVYAMGGRSDLAEAMHAGWPRKHVFKAIPGEALTGLVQLAEAAIGGRRGAGVAGR